VKKPVAMAMHIWKNGGKKAASPKPAGAEAKAVTAES
jgi:hypothetical protein